MKSSFYFGLILLGLFFSVCEKTEAQSDTLQYCWVKSLSATYGVYGNAIAADPGGKGDVYFTGGFEGEVDFDPGPGTLELTTGSSAVGIFISKFNGSGNIIWAKAMVGPEGAYSHTIAIDPARDGAVYIAGEFSGTVDFDPDSNTFNLTSAGSEDIFISKLDSLGNFVWAKAMGGTGSDIGLSIAVDQGSGDVYATGRFSGTVDFNPGEEIFNLASGGLDDIFISKLDGAGNFVWAKAVGAAGHDVGTSIAIDPGSSGDIYTTGHFFGTVDFNPDAGEINLTSVGNEDIFILKLNGAGDYVWAKGMGGTSKDGGNSIALDHDGGNVYITGQFRGTVHFDPGPGASPLNSIGNDDVFISKFDDAGNFLWAKAMGGTGNDQGFSLAIDPAGNGNVYTFGNFSGTADFDPGASSFDFTSTGGSDIFISILNSAGDFVWSIAIHGTGNDFGQSIALEASGVIFVTGFFTGSSISLDDTTLTNVDASGADLFMAKLEDMYMSVATADLDSKAQKINLYPNPATNELTIGIDGEESLQVGITMYNGLGEVVLSRKYENIVHEKTIDISALATDIYFMDINLDGERVIKKIIKQ